MDEQRQQAYSQLIESLLNCPEGEEPEILAANTELLDAGFLQGLAAAAQHYSQQGQESTANWLRNLATQLSAALNLPTTKSQASGETSTVTPENIEVYGQFLQELMLATAESDGDPQIIYPLLTANTDKLDHIFVELLRLWATEPLASAEPDQATAIASVISKWSNLIQGFPLASRANNIEISIAGYEIALTVYTRSAFPQDWARTQNNLGNAYRSRILGERADNREQAIAAYHAALEVYTRSSFPQEWASTQNNLGNAYCNRILGERADNLEQAIAAYHAALEVRTRTAFPQEWAETLLNLRNL